MTNLKVKLTSGFVTAALVAGVVAPAGAMAATNVTISGNGADSYNKVKVKNVKKTSVKQKNTANVSNTIGVNQNTGGNKANKNTGGDVTVTSGNATATVSVTNMTGGNYLAWDSECGCITDTTVDIKDNGADSVNKANIVNYSSTKVYQGNSATITNSIGVSQTTGDNSANKNTGGSVDVMSGDAHAEITVENTTGDNVLGNVTP
jgi:hypothetical protein